ncbi:MAG: hypothetical protein QM602_08135 [Microbacterium sp.]
MSEHIATRRPQYSGTSVVADVQELDLEVGLKQIDGSDRVWLYIGAGPGRELELDAAHARNLVDLIRAAADQART